MIISSQNGWGNQVLAWIAAYLWAIATNRTLLLENRSIYSTFFENPFEPIPLQRNILGKDLDGLSKITYNYNVSVTRNTTFKLW